MVCGLNASCCVIENKHDNHLCLTCKNNREVMTEKLSVICVLCMYPTCNYELKL